MSRASRIRANAWNPHLRFGTPDSVRKPSPNRRPSNASGTVPVRCAGTGRHRAHWNGLRTAEPRHRLPTSAASASPPRESRAAPARNAPHARRRRAGGRWSGLRTHDQIDVALPDPRLLAHLLMGDGKRPQRLGNDLPGIGKHREFAAPRADHLAVDEDDVARGRRPTSTCPASPAPRLARLIIACSWVPSPSCSVAKHSLPGIAGEHHPAGDADDVCRSRCRPAGRGRPCGSRRACGCARPPPGTARAPRRAAARAWPDGSGTARGCRPV